MKFIKIETGFGGWDEYTDSGQFVTHLTNHEHYQLVQQHVSNHASDWIQHFSLWYTNHSDYMWDYLINSLMG